MRTFEFRLPRVNYLRAAGLCGALILASLALAGCANHDEEKLRAEFSEEALSPRPPGFLTGPAAVLLTNASGFSARLTVDRPGSTNNAHALTGQLVGQGSHLIFSPLKDDKTPGDKTFIWDVQTHSGYVLSESMQGYAPISSAAEITNVMTTSQTVGPGGDRVNGHAGHMVEVAVSTDDGETATFDLWRASDLRGFPVRIATTKADPPFVINLSDVKYDAVSPTLFAPPDGFTRYDSPEAMIGELVLRRSKLKTKAVQEQLPPMQPGTAASVPASTYR